MFKTSIVLRERTKQILFSSLHGSGNEMARNYYGVD